MDIYIYRERERDREREICHYSISYKHEHVHVWLCLQDMRKKNSSSPESKCDEKEQVKEEDTATY